MVPLTCKHTHRESRVVGTMVVRSSSVRVIVRSNPSQVPPLLMHVGKLPAVLSAAKRLALVAPEVDLRECTLHLPPQKKMNKAEPTPALKPRGGVTRNLKQGYQWPPKKDICPPKIFFEKNHSHRE